jgi:hypothetical protein
MKKFVGVTLVALLGLILAACSSATSSTSSPATPLPAAPLANTTSVSTGSDLVRVSDEAMVTVEITPLNLDDKAAITLNFTVGLNTHSVDLSYDYKSIATLSNDAGDKVPALKWDGPSSGGHHVSGTLSFPALKNRGQTLTLTLRGIANVPERTFTWKVN